MVVMFLTNSRWTIYLWKEDLFLENGIRSLFQQRLIIILEVLHQKWREDFPPEEYDFLPEYEEDDRNTRGTLVRRR